jgi:MtrB/PioB family decaheme-associated outer membrane protein
MKTIRKYFAVSKLTLAVQAALLAISAAPLAAVAAEEDIDPATLTQPTNSVEIGVQNVSRDSAKFGEYSGLNKSGASAVGNVSVRGGDAYKSYDGGTGVTRWEIRGTDLGTTSRELGGTVSSQGTWNLGVNFDQLRHQITDSYQTPFIGPRGGNTFSLPANFGVIDATDGGAAGTGTQGMTANQVASFHTQDVYTERKNTSFNAGYNFGPQWSTNFGFNRLDQSGAKLISVSMSPDALGFGAGEKIATLMNPTNYTTDTFDLAVNWVGDKGHLKASYFASLFKNGDKSVSWQNPYEDNGGGTTGNAPAGGAFPINTYATPPDNNFFQLNLLGGYDFTSDTKLAGGLSYGRNTQNTSFINDPLLTSALPRPSLDGVVITTHADMKLTNQTTKDLMLSAGLKYNERDNRTPSNIFSSFQSVAGDPFAAVVNAPLSNKKYQLELAGNYRLDKKQTIRLSYEYEGIKRWCNNGLANSAQSADVVTAFPAYYTGSACVQSPQSKENKLSANYKLKTGVGLTFNTGYSFAKRQADINNSYYNPMQTSAEGLPNYGYVPYFDASRKEQVLKAGVNWQASDKVNLGLNARHVDDKYDDSTLGVQKGSAWGLNLDAAYNYAQNGVVSAYFSVQHRERDLSSSADKSPLVPVAADTLWNNRLTDDTNTVGITGKHKGLMGGRLELAGDLSYSLGKSRYSTQAQNCTNNTDPVACGDPTTNSGTVPDIRNQMLRVKLTGDYQVDKSGKVTLIYLYKKLKSNDYYYSAYQLGSTDVTVLPTNQVAPNYSVSLIAASYTYSFK